MNLRILIQKIVYLMILNLNLYTYNNNYNNNYDKLNLLINKN